MFGEFNEATQLETSLAKYSIKFNDLAAQMRPHRIAYLRLLLDRRYTLLYVRRSVGKLCGYRFAAQKTGDLSLLESESRRAGIHNGDISTFVFK